MVSSEDVSNGSDAGRLESIIQRIAFREGRRSAYPPYRKPFDNLRHSTGLHSAIVHPHFQIGSVALSIALSRLALSAARFLPLASVPVELILETCLSIDGSRQGAHRNFEFPAAKGADPDYRSAT